MTRPWRRITLHLSQIFLTLGFTFMALPLLLVPINDPTSGEVVGTEFNDYAILRKDSDVVLTHLSADVSENFVSVGKLDAEHGVRQRLNNRALDLDGTVFFSQGALSSLSVLKIAYGFLLYGRVDLEILRGRPRFREIGG
jgi:hypothetical protein